MHNNDIKTIFEFLGHLEVEVLDFEKGFIRCPGEHLHTSPTRSNHCTVFSNVNGIRVHCFHQSCADHVFNLNQKLARHFKWKHANTSSWRSAETNDAARSASKHLRQTARDAKLGILRDYRWPYAAIIADSPESIDFKPRHHWYYVLNLFRDNDVVWIGRDIWDSGKPSYRRRFRHALDWMAERVCPGMFVCPNTFKSGVHSRSDANILTHNFLVVESDTLGRDEVGAIFQWMEKAKGMRLRAVVDTAGKSLHGWFDYPPPELSKELKITLPELGCDKALFGASQPCRLPGATRDGKYQTLIYIAQ